MFLFASFFRWLGLGGGSVGFLFFLKGSNPMPKTFDRSLNNSNITLI